MCTATRRAKPAERTSSAATIRLTSLHLSICTPAYSAGLETFPHPGARPKEEHSEVIGRDGQNLTGGVGVDLVHVAQDQRASLAFGHALEAGGDEPARVFAREVLQRADGRVGPGAGRVEARLEHLVDIVDTLLARIRAARFRHLVGEDAVQPG